MKGGLVRCKTITIFQEEGCFCSCVLIRLLFFSFIKETTCSIATAEGSHGCQSKQHASVHRHHQEPSRCHTGEGDRSQRKQVGTDLRQDRDELIDLMKKQGLEPWVYIRASRYWGISHITLSKSALAAWTISGCFTSTLDSAMRKATR